MRTKPEHPPVEDAHLINELEKKEIEQEIEYEIVKSHYKMILLGGITNIFSGFIIVYILSGHVKNTVLMSWYTVLIGLNIINIGWALYHKGDIENLKVWRQWRSVFCILFAIICITWGSMSILFEGIDQRYQLYILAFLLAVLIGFSFSSVTDFKLALISISGLLVPTILFYFTYGIVNYTSRKVDPNLYLGIGSSLFILGIFLLIVSRIGSRLVRKFFQLSLTNVALSRKLENINKSLKTRIKERTAELEESLNEVTFHASHDLLTNLPNQRSLLTYIKIAMAVAQEKGHMFAVVYFSINELDRIYDALGHQAGDMIIQTVAQLFQKRYGELQTKDIKDHNYIITLSRKDIFVIILQPIYSVDDIEARIQPLIELLTRPIYTEKQLVKLTASIGVSIYPTNGRDTSALLMNADAAMLLAKQSGGNSIRMYTSEINASNINQLELETKLHDALLQGEFLLQYQPIIDLTTGFIAGMEALVRWESPTLGRIPPDKFIPIAEANGIIIPLSEWVIREACIQTKKWHDLGYNQLKIAINLSAKQLQQPFFAQYMVNLVKKNNFDPQWVELELTETAAFQEEFIPILLELKAEGFSLSIDDFGTGYSGLSNIRLFTIDKIKIDKSFVQDIDTLGTKAIVKNTLALAKSIDVTVIAEGVETKDQLDFLIKNHCDMAQGFIFAPPVDADIFTKILTHHTSFI